MNHYELIYDFKDSKHYISELSSLIRRQNKIYLEEWMSKWYRDENCIPFALINSNNEIVCVIGIVKTNFYIKETKHIAIQLCDLIIKQEYEKDKVGDKLISHVIKKYTNIADLIFTFDPELENKLLDKDFKILNEVRCSIPWKTSYANIGAVVKKINPDNLKDLEFLQLQVKHSTRMSKTVDLSGDTSVKMFNIIKNHKSSVYYVPSFDVTVIISIHQDTFTLFGVYSKNDVDIMALLKVLVPSGIKEVLFGFVPNIDNLIINEVDSLKVPENCTKNPLIIKPISLAIEKHQILVPILSRQK